MREAVNLPEGRKLEAGGWRLEVGGRREGKVCSVTLSTNGQPTSLWQPQWNEKLLVSLSTGFPQLGLVSVSGTCPPRSQPVILFITLYYIVLCYNYLTTCCRHLEVPLSFIHGLVLYIYVISFCLVAGMPGIWEVLCLLPQASTASLIHSSNVKRLR